MPVTLGKERLGVIKLNNGDKVRIKLYSIADLAINVNRTVYTIRGWEKQGWIPKAVFRIKSNRYYTKSQIQLITYLAIKHGMRKKSEGGRGVGTPMSEQFIDEVHTEMKELIKFLLEGAIPEDLDVAEGQVKHHG